MKHYKYILLTGFFGILLTLFPLSAMCESAPTTDGEMPLKDLQRFTTAIRLIKGYYVDPVSDEKILENAIRGMAEGLDPHSTYLDLQDFKDLLDSTSGEFSGLGLEV